MYQNKDIKIIEHHFLSKWQLLTCGEKKEKSNGVLHFLFGDAESRIRNNCRMLRRALCKLKSLFVYKQATWWTMETISAGCTCILILFVIGNDFLLGGRQKQRMGGNSCPKKWTLLSKAVKGLNTIGLKSSAVFFSSRIVFLLVT